MKTIFIVISCIIALILTYIYISSPVGQKQVDRILFGQDRLDRVINSQWRG